MGSAARARKGVAAANKSTLTRQVLMRALDGLVCTHARRCCTCAYEPSAIPRAVCAGPPRWGVFLTAAPGFTAWWQWLAVVSPVATMLLLRHVSGVPLLEEMAQKRWGEHADKATRRASSDMQVRSFACDRAAPRDVLSFCRTGVTTTRGCRAPH